MKKYAIVILQTLNVKQFDFKDELHVAINALKGCGRQLVVLKWNELARTYVVQEQVDF